MTLKGSKQKLDLPADAIELGHVVRREDLPGERREVVPVLALERHADHTRHQRPVVAVDDADVEIEHGLLVDEAERQSLLDADGATLAVVDRPARAGRARTTPAPAGCGCPSGAGARERRTAPRRRNGRRPGSRDPRCRARRLPTSARIHRCRVPSRPWPSPKCSRRPPRCRRREASSAPVRPCPCTCPTGPWRA
jgi:hypothetical protein